MIWWCHLENERRRENPENKHRQEEKKVTQKQYKLNDNTDHREKSPKQIEKEETFIGQEDKKKEKNEHSGSNNENHETSFGIGVYG